MVGGHSRHTAFLPVLVYGRGSAAGWVACGRARRPSRTAASGPGERAHVVAGGLIAAGPDEPASKPAAGDLVDFPAVLVHELDTDGFP